ncbi:glycosyltransferase family 4 protein [Thermodesulfovibrionales bacterium]|nr:glycosyltransferase family 4 protein [Thermodesulfovibrionales bacterium]
MKILFITNIISPYRIPLWNYLYQMADFDFKIVVLAEKEANREWQVAKDQIKFDYQILSGWHAFIWKKEIPIHINRGIIRALRQYNPDVVITSGYDSLAYWQAFLYCKFFKKKFILWNGTTLLSTKSIKGIRGKLKKIIIQGADRYIAYGTKAKEYLEHFGAKSEDIHISINTVDMDYFQGKVFQYRNSKNFSEERKKYPKFLLLYVGQLIKRKGVIQVLKALDYLGDPQIGFIIIGKGTLEKELKEFCKEKSLQNVFFEGFHQQEELPKYYALADIFILPTFQEVWGLVVNEALASGLYVLCSKYAGAAYDLINNENGKIFNPNDIEELAILIRQTKQRIEDIQKQQESISKQACDKFSIKKSAQAFIKAIETFNIKKEKL